MTISNVKIVPPHQGMGSPFLHGSYAKSPIWRSYSVHPLAGTTYLACHRSFSWGSKHKFDCKNSGKVWKGFSTHHHIRCRKALPRRTFWNRDLIRYSAAGEWRPSSTWGNAKGHASKGDSRGTVAGHAKDKTDGDWYSTYQERKRQQYDTFMRKMEEDPIGMLFGRTWANWVDDAEAKLTKMTAANSSVHNAASPTKNKNSDRGFKSSCKSQEEVSRRDVRERQIRHTDMKTENHLEGYDIDPITNRKVPKKSSTTEESFQSNPRSEGPPKGIDIPVKRFKPHRSELKPNDEITTDTRSNVKSSSITDLPHSAAQPLNATHCDTQQHHAKDGPVLQSFDSNSDVVKTKIESALDRHLLHKGSKIQDSRCSTLQYEPSENKSDDVDLLRSSDVRASAGLRGRSAKERETEKQARQKKLEQEHHVRICNRDNQLLREVSNKGSGQVLSGDEVSKQSESDFLPVSERIDSLFEVDTEKIISASTTPDWANRCSENEASPQPRTGASGKHVLQATESEKANKIKAQIVPIKARLDAIKADYDALRQRWLDEKRRQQEKLAKMSKNMLEAEVKAQKLAMEDIEVRSADSGRSHHSSEPGQVRPKEDSKEFAPAQIQSLIPGEGDVASNVHEFANRGRWYKNKAPHANSELEAKFKRIAEDKNLVREIRDIYEDAYGIIDTQHRQSDSKSDLLTPPIDRDCYEPAPLKTTSQTSSSHRGPASYAESSLLPSLPSSPSRPHQSAKSHQGVPHLNDSTAPEVIPFLQSISEQLCQVQHLVELHNKKLKHMKNLKQSWLSKSVHDESKISKPASLYRILTYNATEQSVICSQVLPVPPFTEEQPLPLVEAMAVLSTPGKFLAHVVGLHARGYKAVSAKSNTLVLRRSATTKDFWKTESERCREEDDFIVSKTVPDYHPESTQRPDKIGATEAPMSDHDEHQNKDAVSTRAASDSEAPLSQKSAVPLPNSSKIRREEEVFSGSSRRNWQDAENLRSTKRHKRVGKRRKNFKNIMVTGTITAGCCYVVGVVSQMMQ